MSSGVVPNSPILCPRSDCPSRRKEAERSPNSGRAVRKGSFLRRGYPAGRIQRFQCLDCRRSFSKATFEPEYRQRRRELNQAFGILYASCLSQRRLALAFQVNRKTAVRKFVFLALQARLAHESWLRSLPPGAFTRVHWDEMESFEHTKLKPLSIPLVVCAQTRRILGFQVASMPAKGLLAERSRRKYGPRADHRKRRALKLLNDLKPVLAPDVQITSDQNPHYPGWIKRSLPQAQHRTTPGKRGAIVGQGELKKIGFDPLFAFNHTAAMIRYGVSRLVRRTWCTTKRADRLRAHLYIYLHFHNAQLI